MPSLAPQLPYTEVADGGLGTQTVPKSKFPFSVKDSIGDTMKQILLCMTVLLAFTGAAMATDVTDTSESTTVALAVNVLSSVTIDCGSPTLTFQAVPSATADTTLTAKSVSCTINAGGRVPTSSGSGVVLQASLVGGNLTDGATTPNTIDASEVKLSPTGSSGWTAMQSDGSFVAFLTQDAMPDSPQAVYVQVTVPEGQAPAHYTGTLDLQLAVTYTP
jgi:hypothetical protein